MKKQQIFTTHTTLCLDWNCYLFQPKHHNKSDDCLKFEFKLQTIILSRKTKSQKQNWTCDSFFVFSIDIQIHTDN